MPSPRAAAPGRRRPSSTAFQLMQGITVHAGALSALVETAAGYRFYFAVYVANVSPLTPVYMALIEPFRRFLVYPAMLGNLRAAWVAAYPEIKGSTT